MVKKKKKERICASIKIRVAVDKLALDTLADLKAVSPASVSSCAAILVSKTFGGKLTIEDKRGKVKNQTAADDKRVAHVKNIVEEDPGVTKQATLGISSGAFPAY